MIYLVRHAEAGVRSSCDEHDVLRPLDAEGRRQAIALRDLLHDVALDGVVSSPFVRCMETVIPIAAHRMLPIEPHHALREATPLPLVLDLLREYADRSALLCTHGDVIGGVLGYLGESTSVDLAAHDRPIAKGSTWVLSGASDGSLAGVEYLPPP